MSIIGVNINKAQIPPIDGDTVAPFSRSPEGEYDSDGIG